MEERRRSSSYFLLVYVAFIGLWCHWCSSVIASQFAQDIRWSVKEESVPRVFIGDLRHELASSPSISSSFISSLDDVRFRLLPKPNQFLNFLNFNELTGVMMTSSTTIDRETQCPRPMMTPTNSCSVEVSVALFRSVQLVEVLHIRIDILDINDHSPTFDLPLYELSLSESSIIGTSFPLPMANDDDGSQFGAIDYQMEPTFSELLLVSSKGSSGTVLPFLVLNSTVDRERAPFYEFRLTATDGGGQTGSTKVLVSLEDINDNAPVFAQSQYLVSVREDHPVNASHAIFTASATDSDAGNNAAIDYGFDPETLATYGKVFSMNLSHGQLTLKQPLDHEHQTTYKLRILATDRGGVPLTGQTMLVINVVDVNDNHPLVTVNTLTGSKVRSEVMEHQGPGVFVAHVSVYDLDSADSGQVICRLVSGSDSFSLDGIVSGQYKLTTRHILDYNDQTSYIVTVLCSDSAIPPLSTAVSLTVDVIDQNDFDPVFSEPLYNISILENNSLGAFLLQCNATDADAGLNGRLVFRLEMLQESKSSSGSNFSDSVIVDPDTCVLVANRSFDYETTKQLEFLIRSEDLGDPRRSSYTRIVLNILDANDEAPKFSQLCYSFQVSENLGPGSFVGQVMATDRDSDQFNQFQFKISDRNPATIRDMFVVDGRSGIVTSGVTFDREQCANYSLIMTVYDSNSPLMISQSIVEITVTDDNDNFPLILLPDQHSNFFNVTDVSLPTNSNSFMFQVAATDPDAGLNSTLVFGLIGPNAKFFSIERLTGEVSFNPNATFRSGPASLLPVTITVEDSGTPPKMTSVEIFIAVPCQIVVEGSWSFGDQTDGEGGTTPPVVAMVMLPVCVSIIVIVLLLASIGLLRRHDRQCRRRRRGITPKDTATCSSNADMYRCRVEEEKMLQGRSSSSKYPDIMTHACIHEGSLPPWQGDDPPEFNHRTMPPQPNTNWSDAYRNHPTLPAAGTKPSRSWVNDLCHVMSCLFMSC